MSKAKLIRKVSEEIVLREDITYDGEQVYYDGEAVFYEHPPINSSKYEYQIEENPAPAAIRHIEADLTSTKPSETKQNASWMSCVSNFFWKLYEKTLKAFFDSLLGKYGPK